MSHFRSIEDLEAFFLTVSTAWVVIILVTTVVKSYPFDAYGLPVVISFMLFASILSQVLKTTTEFSLGSVSRLKKKEGQQNIDLDLESSDRESVASMMVSTFVFVLLVWGIGFYFGSAAFAYLHMWYFSDFPHLKIAALVVVFETIIYLFFQRILYLSLTEIGGVLFALAS